MAIFAPAESLPSPATLVMPRCRFKRQEHGDSWMVPTTQMLWLQRRWFCQTVGRITLEVQSHSASSSLALQQQHWLSFPIQYSDNFAYWPTVFSQRVVTCIARISQVSYNDSIITGFATTGQRAGCKFLPRKPISRHFWSISGWSRFLFPQSHHLIAWAGVDTKADVGTVAAGFSQVKHVLVIAGWPEPTTVHSFT